MAKVIWHCPSEWLAAGLHARNRWRLPVLLRGILFARGRRHMGLGRQPCSVSTLDFLIAQKPPALHNSI